MKAQGSKGVGVDEVRDALQRRHLRYPAEDRAVLIDIDTPLHSCVRQGVEDRRAARVREPPTRRLPANYVPGAGGTRPNPLTMRRVRKSGWAMSVRGGKPLVTEGEFCGQLIYHGQLCSRIEAFHDVAVLGRRRQVGVVRRDLGPGGGVIGDKAGVRERLRVGLPRGMGDTLPRRVARRRREIRARGRSAYWVVRVTPRDRFARYRRSSR